jgi:hypothetical protein
MKLSRELESVSNQIRAAVVGGARNGVIAAPAVTRGHAANGGHPKGAGARQRFAFTAVMTENGAVIAQVLEQTYGIWPQQE